MARIVVGEGITRSVFEVKGVDLGKEEAPYWTTLGKRESYKPRPSSEDKPPKNRDGAWYAKIRLIDPDGEEFTKTLQLVPTSRILSEKEDTREIIDLDHFYDTKFLIKNEEEIFTVRGDGVRIKPDARVSSNVIFDKKKPGSS
ncbi:hypothetical protein Tco_0867323 [Tanacetum coccineum]